MSTLAGPAFQPLASEAAPRDVLEAGAQKSTGRSRTAADRLGRWVVTIDPQNFAIYSSAQAFSYTHVDDEIVSFTCVVVC